MPVYAALIKGINVGGRHLVKMEDLRRLFEALGFPGAKTYLQSGNVVFYANEAPPALRERIQKEFADIYGFPAPLVLRDAKDLSGALSAFPYAADENAPGRPKTAYVAFLPCAPTPQALARFDTFKKESEAYTVHKNDVFLYFPEGMRNSKLAANLHLLSGEATLRNQKTLAAVTKLALQMKKEYHEKP